MAFAKMETAAAGSGAKVAEGTFTWSGETAVSDLGFKPKRLCIATDPAEAQTALGNSPFRIIYYDEDVNPEKALYCDSTTDSGATYRGWKNITGSSQVNLIKSIDANGFTMSSTNINWTKPLHYFAIG